MPDADVKALTGGTQFMSGALDPDLRPTRGAWTAALRRGRILKQETQSICATMGAVHIRRFRRICGQRRPKLIRPLVVKAQVAVTVARCVG